MRAYQHPIKKNIIATTTIHTPLGEMFCAATAKGICLLSFFNQKNLEKQIEKVKNFFDADIMPAHNNYFDCLQKELNEYFDKKRETFTVPLQLVGTSYQQSVWKILMAIPYGNTLSYAEEAKLLNQPKSARAVANANAQNMISILIPCHRVIQSNGHLGGYAGGVDKKQTLLSLENNFNMV